MANSSFETLEADFFIWDSGGGFRILGSSGRFWILDTNGLFWLLDTDGQFRILATSERFRLLDTSRLFWILGTDSSDSSVCRELKYVYMILLTWLSLNKLKLNCDKTELLVIGSQHSPVSQLFSFKAVDGSVINPTHSASNISVIFYNNLNMERQVAVICNSAFFTFAIFLVLGSSCQLKAPKF